ncbi:MAG: DUF1844 domain-containing protein [Acidobacteriota bacterium]
MSDDSRQPPDEEPSIKVTDRRQFDRDGRRRQSDVGPTSPTGASSAGSSTSTAPAPDGSRPAAAGSPPPPPPVETASSRPPGPKGTTPGQKVDFQQFVYFLYMSALHELGAPTEPGAAPRAPDLDRSRFFIDVLTVLKEKTAGNLSTGETKLLDDVVYNLQMQFMSASAAPTA